MAVLEIQGNGESSYVPQEAISSAIQLLEDPLHEGFVTLLWQCTSFLHKGDCYVEH